MAACGARLGTADEVLEDVAWGGSFCGQRCDAGEPRRLAAFGPGVGRCCQGSEDPGRQPCGWSAWVLSISRDALRYRLERHGMAREGAAQT